MPAADTVNDASNESQRVTGRRSWRAALVAALLGGVAVAATVVPSSAGSAAVTGGTPSALVPLTPCRVLDTRDDGPAPVAAASDVRVSLAGRCGVPAGTTAVSIVVTAIGAGADGYVAAWPSDAPATFTSVLNVDRGDIRSSGALVAVSRDGSASVTLRSSVAAEWIVDVTAAFVPAESPRAGRFVAITPTRALDTRTTGAPVGDASSVTIPLPPGAPADATALALTVTATESRAPGFVTAHPAGTTRPLASALFVDRVGQTRTSSAVIGASPNGVTLFTQGSTHLVVDVVGWFTGPSASPSADGRFVPIAPTRLIDTRLGTPVFPAGTVEVPTAAVTGGGVAAIAATVTMTDTWRGGFVTGFAARTATPPTATATADHRRDTVAQLAITGVSANGIAITSNAGTDVVVDLTGWFTGAPAATTGGAAPNTPVVDRARRVLLLGDSTLAGVRWYSNSQRALGGGTFVLETESCRRLIGTSCRGREGRLPPNAIDALRAAANRSDAPFDVVVVMTGYNDWHTTFTSAFERLVAEARAAGAQQIVWLTYRERTAYLNPTGGTPQDRGYAIQNQILREMVMSGRYPDVVVADWNEYTTDRPTWTTTDGVHLTVRGSYGVADYISRHIAAANGEPCSSPRIPGGPLDTPCPNPDDAPLVVDPLELYSGNPNDVHCYEVGADRHTECRVDPRLG
jgi:hypothetical protein